MSEVPNSTAIYRRLLRHVKPYRGMFALGILMMLVLGLTEAGIPAMLKPVLDGTFVDKDPVYLQWAPLAIVALFAVRGLAGIASHGAFAAVATRVVFDLREKMFARLLSLPTSYYDQSISGKLVSKLIYDVTNVTQASTEVLTVLVKDSITAIALLAYLFWLDWQLSLFTFILGPVLAFIAHNIGGRIRNINRELQTRFGDMTHVLEETIKGHKVVKIYGGQDYERQRFSGIAKRVRHLQFKHKIAAHISVPIVELFGSFIIAAVMFIGTARAEEDQLTVGGFVAFFTALGLLFSPIKRLTKINDPLQRGLAAAESIFALIDEQAEQDKGTYSAERSRGEVRFEQVCLRYPGCDADALGPIDLTLRPMATTALVGASGSGKTTLANLIPRIYTPTEGRVVLDDVDVRDWSLASLRQQIAYVSQDVVLFNDTVARNIAYGSDADDQAIRDAAEASGSLEFIENMPEGFDTMIGENGVRLSGGQRQRLAIARALLADAPLLILDEATSALDTQSERLVQKALETLCEHRTTLVIAHRLSTIQSADHILVFQDGQVVEQGTHDQLLGQQGVYASLVQSHAFEEAETEA